MTTYSNLIGQKRRRELCEHRVTLNGEPAVISGALCKFAKVTTLGAHGVSVEFSWVAVQRIIAENDGEFFS